VQDDEFDKGKRQILNLGHTLGHSIEKMSGYTIPHGSAVAIGLSIISDIAEKTGISKEPIHDRISSVLKKYGLPTTTDYPIEKLAEIALADKKINSNTISLVIPRAIGDTILYVIPVSELEKFLAKEV
jgi:3-dehydroquinate synthase